LEGTCTSPDNNNNNIDHDGRNTNSVTCHDSATSHDNNTSSSSSSSNGNTLASQDDDVSNKIPSDCQDKTSQCDYWTEVGECQDNPTFMKTRCPRSCQMCPDQLEEILTYGSDLGERQLLTSSIFQTVTQQESVDLIVTVREYIKNLKLHKDIMDMCVNKDESCTIWAIAGECDKNPIYSKCVPRAKN
jgi:hypothetical protein